MIRSKKEILSGGNELADLVGLSLIGLRVMAFWDELDSWLYRITPIKLYTSNNYKWYKILMLLAWRIAFFLAFHWKYCNKVLATLLALFW